MRRARHQWWLVAVVLVALLALLAVFAELRAQTVAGEDAQILAIDESLGAAMRAGDKSAVRRLLALQFSFVDESGRVVPRKEFLADLKTLAAAPTSDAKIKSYGRIAIVSGHRKSAHGNDTFFLDIWAKQKGAWRTLAMQDVVVVATGVHTDAAVPPAPAAAEAKSYDCKNPCQAIPYRVRSPAEQDIVTAFQAIERAAVAHDADEWAKHIADEFELYGTGRTPVSKSGRIAAIKRQKDGNAPTVVGEVQAMRLSVYDDAAAMMATHVMPDGGRPPYRAARIWVKRNGLWQMVISVQTTIAGS